METRHFIDTNDENRHELHEFLCHEGSERLGELVQIREIGVSISVSS